MTVAWVAVLSVLGLTILVLPNRDHTVDASVVGIVSGDTVIIQLKSSVERIRLASVETPASSNPSGPNQCLKAQATSALRQLLPDGKAIKIEYDGKAADRFGRKPAAVFLDDGTFVNAQIAREGLGVAMASSRSSNFLNRVTAAQRRAFDSHRGFFDPGTKCTVAAKQKAILVRIDKAKAVKPKTVAQARAARAELVDAIADLKAFNSRLSADHTDVMWLAYTGDLQGTVSATIASVIENGNEVEAALAAEETSLAGGDQDSSTGTDEPTAGTTPSTGGSTGSTGSTGGSSGGGTSTPNKGHHGKECSKGQSKKC